MKTLKQTLSVLSVLAIILLSSCEKNELNTIDEVSNNENSFDFNQFGRAHNDYLAYVHATGFTNRRDRFEYGKTYNDPIFGSFDVGINYDILDQGMPAHLEKVQRILEGTYDASEENLSDDMTQFLNQLATLTHQVVANENTIEQFIFKIETLENQVKASHTIEINLDNDYANDGASMLAIASILKYSIQYWDMIDNPSGKASFWQKVKRALADAWGYVSAWTNNGDGSYSWDPDSALVNADCHSDRVYEN